MVRLVGLALGASLVVGTIANGQPPRDRDGARPPARQANVDRELQRAPGEQRPPIHDGRWHRRPLVGWPYLFGYPIIYVDPFGLPIGSGVVPYQYGVTYPTSPVVDLPNGLTLPPANPMPKEDAPPEPKPPIKPKAPPKPRDELDRHADIQKVIRAGNDSFAQGDYVKAARYYQQATDADALDPTGFFYLAQAQFAQGKFAEAGVSIQRGLLLRPDWPEAPFDPRALYGETPGHYDRHLALLAELVSKNKNDDGLLFLLGYELWFDGKRDEARVLFKRAASLTLNPMHVERFLKAKS